MSLIKSRLAAEGLILEREAFGRKYIVGIYDYAWMLELHCAARQSQKVMSVCAGWQLDMCVPYICSTKLETKEQGCNSFVLSRPDDSGKTLLCFSAYPGSVKLGCSWNPFFVTRESWHCVFPDIKRDGCLGMFQRHHRCTHQLTRKSSDLTASKTF